MYVQYNIFLGLLASLQPMSASHSGSAAAVHDRGSAGVTPVARCVAVPGLLAPQLVPVMQVQRVRAHLRCALLDTRLVERRSPICLDRAQVATSQHS